MIFDAIGYFGAGLILLAYLLSATGRWPASGTRSAAVNLVSGTALVTNGLYHGATPSVVLNTVWALIGAGTLLRARMRSGRDVRRRPAEQQPHED